MRDVTSIVKEKKEMIDARKKAEDISLAKSFFLAQASHDLRQPAQAIRMMLYHLDLKNMSEKQEDTISELKLIGGNLSHLLDNLMDISKIDYAEDHYSPYSFSLAKFLKPLLKEFSAIATTSKISFKKKVVDVKIFSDEFYLERLLRNLLSNAVKFTKNSVEFLTSVDEDRLNISIIDNGCGISKADMKYIFDDFFQSTNAKRKKLGGVGLGLPIVKKTADLLDINIEVTSKHNKGTRFDLIIKIK